MIPFVLLKKRLKMVKCDGTVSTAFIEELPKRGKRSELANPTYLSVNRLVSFVANKARSLYNCTVLFYDHTHYVWHFIPRQSLFEHFKLK